MSEVITVHLDTTELDRIARELNRTVEDIMVDVAFNIENEAKRNAPVRTGALRNSLYTKTKRGGTNPRTMAGVNYVDIPSPDGDIAAVVGASTDYAIWVELGHDMLQKDGSKRHVAAQPFLGPAAEKWRRKFNDGSMFKRIFEK